MVKMAQPLYKINLLNIVLLNLVMPKRIGLIFLTTVKGNPELKFIPTIIKNVKEGNIFGFSKAIKIG